MRNKTRMLLSHVPDYVPELGYTERYGALRIKRTRFQKLSKTLHVADGVGFEPTRGVNLCRFSRPVPSTTRPPVQVLGNKRIPSDIILIPQPS